MNYKFNSGSINLEDVTGEVNGTGLIISTRAYARIIMYSAGQMNISEPPLRFAGILYIYVMRCNLCAPMESYDHALIRE